MSSDETSAPDVTHPMFARHYDAEDPEITEQTRTILVKYSGIPEDQIVKHVREIRDKGWAIFTYPCIGKYRFLSFNISKHSQYASVLQRLKSDNETLLDLGCCFGQSIRKLVFDGAPPENLFGSELEPDFINLGYDLFKDKGKLASKFTTGDFFGPEVAGLKPESFDMVFAASFFHLFNWDQQVEAVVRALKLLKPKPGSMLFGRQTGKEVAEVMQIPRLKLSEMYRHNLESWKKLVLEAQEKFGKPLDSEVHWLDEQNENAEWTFMSFCVKLI